MKSKKSFNSFIGLFLMILIHNSCLKDDSERLNKFPTTPEQIAEAVESTNIITDEGCGIIEDAISSGYYANDLIDPNIIAEQISSIQGVEAVKATSTGTGINIKQKDGTYTNLLVVTDNDERLFLENDHKSASSNMKSVIVTNENPVLPNGSGKALILAPFQASQKTNLDQISKLFQSTGYSVDTYEDDDANLQRFNGDFMNDYDIVFIRTHGAANFYTRGGDISTVLLTGEEYSDNTTNSLSEDEQKAIATGGHDGKSYFAISSQWVKITTSNNFSNSWIYSSACESAMIDQGNSSLSEIFLDLGAAGYNGFDATINTSLATSIAEKMVARFTSGLSFTDASKEVLNDLGLKAKAWTLRLVLKNDDPVHVELFDYNKKISDPFYLIDPDDVVGISKVKPESGVVGTPVVYEVIINSKYIPQVASIEFDIDNTGEHLVMTKISSNTWQRDELKAPISDYYPIIDTFTFSAFDSDGNLIGQGSATFSRLAPLKKSTDIGKCIYYAQ